MSKDLDVVARTPWNVRGALYTALFYAFVLGGECGGSQFNYFQFWITGPMILPDSLPPCWGGGQESGQREYEG